MRRHILTSLAAFVVLTVLLGVLYPLAVYAIGQVAFKHQADGSLIKVNGTVVGSKLIAEDFTEREVLPPPPVEDRRAGLRRQRLRRVRERGIQPGPVESEPDRQRARRQHRHARRIRTRRRPTRPAFRCRPPTRTATTSPTRPATRCTRRTRTAPTSATRAPSPQRVLAYRKENGLAPSVKVPVDAVTASFSGLDPDISVANARLQAPRVATARHLSVDAVLALVSKYTDGRGLGFMGEPGVNVLELNLALDRAIAGR